MVTTLEVEGAEPLRVVRYEGNEALNELFHFDVWITSDDAYLKFADFVGKKASLVLGDPRFAVRRVHGMVRRFELTHQTGRRASYRFELTPLAHRLTLKTDCRIFQGKTAVDIISEVLGGWDLESVSLSVTGSYAVREYCVQYRESDWAFVNRLMEEEGIFFYFDHGETSTKLVIGDAKSAQSPITGDPTVTFRPESGALGDTHEHVTRLAFGEELRTGKVVLRDYNFKMPSVSMEGESAAERDDDLEVYDFPAKFDDPGVGKALAQRWLEARQATKKSGQGSSTCMRFMPGHTFLLGDNADNDIRDDLNIEYLLTRVRHRGAEPDQAAASDVMAYSNEFWVIPAEVPFRPAPRSDKPRVFGAQTAVVTGPGGEEIHTDEHGRIKVQFHWDRLGKGDENSSCWVRVQQPWAGAGWGSVFIPRIGMEVVVEFLEGDPDRPLVTGSVYHASNVPPYGLPGDKTKSTLKSNSSIGGGGFNELRFEDAKGSEEIFIHAQKNWIIVVENDRGMLIKHDEVNKVENNRTRDVLHDETIAIGGTRAKSVGADEVYTITGKKTETIGDNHGLSVGGDQSVTVGGTQTVGVGSHATVGIGGNHTEGVAGNQTIAVGGAFTQNVMMGMTTTAGANVSLTVKKNYTVKVEKDQTFQIMKKATTNVGESWTIVVGKELEVTCGDARLVMKKNGSVSVSGKDVSIKGTGPVKIEGKKIDVKSSGATNVKASGAIKVKGSKITIN